MTRSAARVLALLGLSVAAAGLLAGLMTVKSDGMSCGRAILPSSSDSTCTDKLASVRLVVIPMVLAGALVGGVAWIGRNDND